MTIMTDLAMLASQITAGVDTHGDFHVAAALDGLGRVVATKTFAATAAGDHQMVVWLTGLGEVAAVGVEGTGSYGATLTRCLRANGLTVVEVNRPDRAERRARGKTDTADAVAAARVVQSGRATTIPKLRTGPVEAIRTLRVARCSMVKSRTAMTNQIKAMISTAPEPLRGQLKGLPTSQLISRCQRLRPAAVGRGELVDPTWALKTSLKMLAGNIAMFTDHIKVLDARLDTLTKAVAPTLRAQFGVGPDVAGQLLVTVGDNAHRLHSEAAFARLCGVAPIPINSGQTQGRHRLHRGGDRQANAALHRVVINRLKYDEDTQAYKAKRAHPNRTNKDTIRCLKRYVARNLYKHLIADLTTPQPPA